MRPIAVAEKDSGQSADRRTPVSELEFVGCEPVRVSAAEIEGPEWEGRRVEYWHAASETAWMVREAATVYHEGPGVRLARLVERIGMARGSEAECVGATDLRIRNEDGTQGDLMQADQAVYLDPARAELSRHGRVIIGEDPLPDVVLEVDHTTDVRPGKLLAYEDWGLPEVWVEVPDRGSPGRRRGLPRGLRIYLLEGDTYRDSDVSRAFPGWRADEIHRALNEATISAATEADLWRVGRALGAWEGTVPEDDLLSRRLGDRGYARGAAEGRAATAISILRRRGIEVSVHRVADAVRGAPADAVVEAALTAEDKADFLARLA